MTERRRILVAQRGDDDRGARVAARAHADAGDEVIFTGPASPAVIAIAAVQEAVDVIELSNADDVTAVGAELATRGAPDIVVRAIG